MSRGRAAWMPSPEQLLLLRACLWEEERALEAWAEWRHRHPDLERVERGSYRLLPLLYRNLGPRLAEPDATRLKDIYRRSWSSNQLGLQAGRRAIEALRAAGLEVLLLKGAALIGSAYRDGGARPMGDVDLVVRAERIGDAARVLREAGFAPSEKEPERLLAVRHSLAFNDPDGREIDLHRGMLWRPGLDEEFWQGSIEAEVAENRVRILNPADQLLHVCAHGAAWNPIQPIRWVADAFKVIEASADSLDWDRLVEMTVRGRLTLPVGEALDCLAAEFEAPVPVEARRAIAQTPVTAGERRAHEALSRPPSPLRSLGMLSWFRERHRAHAALEGEAARPTGFVRYLQGFWGLERASQVPGYAMRRLLRRRGAG